MGAWIEIVIRIKESTKKLSHPTMGAWIEINGQRVLGIKLNGRTPRWVRGLKSTIALAYLSASLVAPHDGCVD